MKAFWDTEPYYVVEFDRRLMPSLSVRRVSQKFSDISDGLTSSITTAMMMNS
jgi:hypothetical protein